MHPKWDRKTKVASILILSGAKALTKVASMPPKWKRKLNQGSFNTAPKWGRKLQPLEASILLQSGEESSNQGGFNSAPKWDRKL